MAEDPQMIAGGYVLPDKKKKQKKSRTIGAGYVLPQEQAPAPQSTTPLSPELIPPLGSVIPPMDFSIGGPGYQPGAGFPRQMGQGAPGFPTIASDQGGGAGWFDMFSSSPQLSAQTMQMPQVGGGQTQVQGAPATAAPTPPTDPLTAFLMSRMGGQQQPLIPQFDPAALVKALRYDPVSEHSRLASLPSYAPESQSPFATGYFNQPSIAGLSPEAVLASQGNNATNQWAQLGGMKNIDPELLRRLNQGAAAGRRPY